MRQLIAVPGPPSSISLRRWRIGFAALTLGLLAAVQAADAPPANPPKSDPPRTDPPRLTAKEIYQKTLRATAWITVPEGQALSTGTGWVIEGQRRLLITNHHVVAGANTRVADAPAIQVFFPVFKDGKLISDRAELTRSVPPIRAEVIDSDRTRDLALLRLASLPSDTTVLRLAAASSSPGDAVHSVGNPGASEALWVYTSGSVRQVYRFRSRFNADWVVNFLAVQTQSPTNPGDSGGPVVNDQGELVAVTQSAHREARLFSHFIDVSEVRAYFDEIAPLIDPKTADLWNKRGLRRANQKRYSLALADYSQAIKLNPRFDAALYNRGLAFLDKQDYDSALGDFEAALKLDDADPDYHEARGRALYAKDQLDPAIQEYTSAIRIDQNRFSAYNRRGNAYLDKNQYDSALKDYNEAIRLKPEDAVLFANRALAWSSQKSFPQAVADLSEAIRLDPNFGNAYLRRARAYEAMGELDKADADFARLEKVDPKFAESKKSHYDRRFVRIKNATSHPIKVHVQYRTFTDKKEWRWFPAAPGIDQWLTYSFDPGEAAYLMHDNWKISADRIRLWAENLATAGRWLRDKDKDTVIIPEGGYQAFRMGTYTYEFQP